MKIILRLRGFLALSLIFCLVLSAGLPALAETPSGEAPVQEEEKSLVLQLFENIRNTDWQKLPDELKERVSRLDWEDLQRKIKNYDWEGVLAKIKSFFTKQEWQSVGKEVAHQFRLMAKEGAQAFESAKEFIAGYDLKEFIGSLQGTMESFSAQMSDWADKAGEKVREAEDAVVSFLKGLGII